MEGMKTTQITAHHRACKPISIALAVLAFAIGGCESLPTRPSASVATPESAAAQFLAGDFKSAASSYERIGTQAGDVASVLRAALIHMELGASETALTLVSTLTPAQIASAPTTLQTQIEIGRALALGDINTAGPLLIQLRNADISTVDRLLLQGQTAQFHFRSGEPHLATSYLTRRELWFSADRAITHNHQKIWDGLRDTPPAILQSALALTSDETVRGWIELVLGTGRVLASPRQLANAVDLWVSRYPGHPGNAYFVPALRGGQEFEATELDRVALLLPLGGRAGRAATAIRDGFLAAHLQRGKTTREIAVYDVANAGATAAYNAAVADGADLVVGPLTKSALRELLALQALPVPLLALNRLGRDEFSPGSLYQFALAPEDEAATAARRAVAAGQTTAVALAPYGDWGDRVLTAFAETFRAYGGELVDFERYESAETDFSHEIERVMQIAASVERRNRMRALVGEALQYEPRRRQDIDVIFLAANAANARAIKPQLRFHYSGDIPVFATSAAIASNTNDARDLRGIEFPEIPWLANESSSMTPTLSEFTEFWPRQTTLNRLHAFGIDAHDLAIKLFDESATEDFDDLQAPQQGATGLLSIGGDGIISRELEWARFDGESSAHLERLPMPDLIEEQPVVPAWQSADEPAGSD